MTDDNESVKRPKNYAQAFAQVFPSPTDTSTVVSHSTSSSTSSSTTPSLPTPASSVSSKTSRRRGGTLNGGPPPVLRRCSTISMVASLDLNPGENEAQDERHDLDGEQHQLEQQQQQAGVMYDQQQQQNHQHIEQDQKQRPSQQLEEESQGQNENTQSSADETPRASLFQTTVVPGRNRIPLQELSPRITVLSEFPCNAEYWHEYLNETLEYLMEIEDRYDRCMYFQNQPNLNPGMRQTLVQWLMELCYGAFKFKNLTLHHSVSILDRFITASQVDSVNTDNLQCIGICALMIAGKLMESEFKFSTDDLSRLCDRVCTPADIAEMEIRILVTLKFEVLEASAKSFADFYRRAVESHQLSDLLIDFLCDASTLSHEFLIYNQSHIASAVIWIALRATDRDWTDELAIATGYSRTVLMKCVELFVDVVRFCIENEEKLDFINYRYPFRTILSTLGGVFALE
ncbi:G2/mitotic-specific cyclin-B3 [Podila epigama]|nr:G2/mitotic-specific cyclin-B3 [Podila epigama]